MPEISLTSDKTFHNNKNDYILSIHNIPGILNVLIFTVLWVKHHLYFAYEETEAWLGKVICSKHRSR